MSAIRQLLARIAAANHVHRWKPLSTNRWGIVFEQQCKCGAVRHTRINDFSWATGTTTWRDGPHPRDAESSAAVESDSTRGKPCSTT